MAPHTLSPMSASLTEHQRGLIDKTEQALREGAQLLRWCRAGDRERGISAFPLDLKRTSRLPNRAEGYFGELEINGVPTSVMGCRQSIEFGRAWDTGSSGADAATALTDFVLGELLTRAHWITDDGHPGGFGVKQSLYRTVDGSYGAVPATEEEGCVDLRTLGRTYDWILLTLRLHDFVIDIGPLRKRFKMAVCAAPSAEFVQLIDQPSRDHAIAVTFGYPLVPYAPIPNYFGFGPGKFGVAIKLFHFFLRTDGGIRVDMEFAAAPRCQRVLDFGPLPDPIYGGAALLHWITGGLWDSGGFHDRLDASMLAQHCRVHQTLMEGIETKWRDWCRDARSRRER